MIDMRQLLMDATVDDIGKIDSLDRTHLRDGSLLGARLRGNILNRCTALSLAAKLVVHGAFVSSLR
ncbi:hypothetical protein [Bradyrhizobium sp. SEMIA]|uniref:hypothetical protein n=1 Tax=Bradyrhizobium sp. SEMIA TaxID=2597515 RepID=UPI001141FC9D|nr:hypothetical protein [Bradyrhizobium sp. SEMIA]QOG18877.1 hypothetical protein FOM02_17590 [Bradyrhizobium sp. SEMIA]